MVQIGIDIYLGPATLEKYYFVWVGILVTTSLFKQTRLYFRSRLTHRLLCYRGWSLPYELLIGFSDIM